MTDFLPHPNADGLVKLSGTIRNLKVTRDTASFVFTESDQTKMGVIAIAATMAGMGGQAMSAASNASAMEEEADYLEFELNGLPVKGWVWRNPFREGDVVEVAAENTGKIWETYGVARPLNRTIALYPHCSRGITRHFTNAGKWWFIGGSGAILCVTLPLALITVGLAALKEPEFYFLTLGLMAFFALMTWSLTRKWMPFVRLAEKVFRALDLPDPSNIDLVKSSKAQRTEQDPGEFGTFYFRY
ncbi:putative type VI secretion system effector [Quatrionicoccus australiensis]|uniref:putative type VI secretion system effector n=1 Tax=Quatrionicoccus australiensis TaxID=138118 RepID=UPI001CFB145B|nr:putative type VI secretion system effector [Quatrionicoccus australiensis]MCB4359494.1 hypothetical protein [Quatrionicoccus australiensis]